MFPGTSPGQGNSLPASITIVGSDCTNFLNYLHRPKDTEAVNLFL